MQEPANSLDWTAFLYLTGELDGEELQTFEAQLAEDQAAREAVALAVQLYNGVRSAPAELLASHRSAPIRVAQGNRKVWSLIAIAACLFVAISITVATRSVSRDEDRDSDPAAANEAAELALAWIEVRRSLPESDAAFWDEPQEPDSLNFEGESYLSDDSLDFPTTSWIVSAVEEDQQTRPSAQSL